MHQNFKSLLRLSLLALCIAWAMPVWALTAPGTIINNVATITYRIVGETGTFTTQSTTATFQVLELVDARVEWIDVAPVTVSSPDARRATSFRIFNLGNAAHSYLLSPEIPGGGQFSPVIASPAMYRENGLEPGLQLTGPNADAPVSVSDALSFTPQEAKTFYVVCDIPQGAAFETRGPVSLIARSSVLAVRSSPAGTRLDGQGVNGMDLVVGTFAGTAKADGSYVVRGTVVVAEKTAIAVVDDSGGTKITSGSTITYRITISAQGSGVLNNLMLSDPMPAQLDYVANSLTLDGVTLPDLGNVSANAISIPLGNKTAPFTASLQFKAKVR